MYKINMLKKAQKDLDWFRRNDKNSYIKSFDLVREFMSSPRKGTGKPERLKYFEKEVFSRRVNHKDRMVYRPIFGSFYNYISSLLWSNPRRIALKI